MPSQEFWIFGYGSLIWKPPPYYDRRIPGHVSGFVRRFWQASEDHRGTPLAPGRVVTLLEYDYWAKLGEKDVVSNHGKVYGVAYRIPLAKVDEVREYLDIREINGYSIQYTAFYPSTSIGLADEDLHKAAQSGMISECLVYVGLPTNPQFSGPQSLDAVATIITTSHGPSGKNLDYLFNLETSLAKLCVPIEEIDDHVIELARRVRHLVQARSLSD